MYILKYIYCIIVIILTLFLRLYLFIIRRTKLREKYDYYLYKMVNGWARYTLKIIGVKVNIKGLENLPKENCLFVSNHQGNADFLVLMSELDKHLGFLAKKEILKIPVIRTWMKEMHCVFIDRENIRESLKAINKGIENLNNGYSMLIFPEGTRSKSHKLGEFKKGSMKMALKASVPVVPLVIDNSFKVFEEGKGKLKASIINMSILEPINVNDLTKEEKANLADIIKNKIEKELQTLH
ncbi:1-acyl-sn-glycerol-3-phosphate acyltransferase [Clostridium acidisoli DSM 12555]|uniref:1-acyl-sn-glycerol-3-phosphate acyltransferase n=1 Tax=Clostridium acidisoli DSM 12555 TaxID=1121291 RepID=A0A1W1XKR4_9CLOT|nr:lysophospholipid acyltransferase family protein [Clostridium acidisoli]SMC24394.1 1-acyl-sn-glycerol-3-phosphate acyltransferase [Clostridium acidisoli DSM 12555]